MIPGKVVPLPGMWNHGRALLRSSVRRGHPEKRRALGCGFFRGTSSQKFVRCTVWPVVREEPIHPGGYGAHVTTAECRRWYDQELK